MAVVARARRVRRGARRSARRVIRLAFLALALGFGGWHPAATAPALTPTAPAEAAVISAGPIVDLDASGGTVDVLDPTAGAATARVVLADAGSGTLLLGAPVPPGTAIADAQPLAGNAQPFPTALQPVDARPLALPAPVDTRARAQAVRSAAGTRAPPRAV